MPTQSILSTASFQPTITGSMFSVVSYGVYQKKSAIEQKMSATKQSGSVTDVKFLSVEPPPISTSGKIPLDIPTGLHVVTSTPLAPLVEDRAVNVLVPVAVEGGATSSINRNAIDMEALLTRMQQDAPEDWLNNLDDDLLLNITSYLDEDIKASIREVDQTTEETVVPSSQSTNTTKSSKSKKQASSVTSKDVHKDISTKSAKSDKAKTLVKVEENATMSDVKKESGEIDVKKEKSGTASEKKAENTHNSKEKNITKSSKYTAIGDQVEISIQEIDEAKLLQNPKLVHGTYLAVIFVLVIAVIILLFD